MKTWPRPLISDMLAGAVLGALWSYRYIKFWEGLAGLLLWGAVRAMFDLFRRRRRYDTG